jgi:hypothetical protein
MLPPPTNPVYQIFWNVEEENALVSKINVKSGWLNITGPKLRYVWCYVDVPLYYLD